MFEPVTDKQIKDRIREDFKNEGIEDEFIIKMAQSIALEYKRQLEDIYEKRV